VRPLVSYSLLASGALIVQATTATPHLPKDAPVWLAAGEAAAQLGVHGKTLLIWAKAGEIPSYVTPGGRHMYREADIIALLDAGGKSA